MTTRSGRTPRRTDTTRTAPEARTTTGRTTDATTEAGDAPQQAPATEAASNGDRDAALMATLNRMITTVTRLETRVAGMESAQAAPRRVSMPASGPTNTLRSVDTMIVPQHIDSQRSSRADVSKSSEIQDENGGSTSISTGTRPGWKRWE
ncbi:hypothetical protein PInf_002397 [Phytophthora infestans]|nr:hypothetical protein PInf_002397 [Phytophthora infestans]